MSDELREQLAAVQHDIWAHWMKYLFSRTEGSDRAEGAIIPNVLVLRWQRQMETPYAELSDKERESDRHQADKVLAVVQSALAAATQRAEQAEADAAMCSHYAKRALEAEAKLAAVPWGAISLVVWMLDDGPYDQVAVDEVNRWLDTQPGLAEQRELDIENRCRACQERRAQSEVQP